MVKNLNNKILYRFIFEVRYYYGFTYLDRCGRTINRIMRENPEWRLYTKEPNPQEAPLINIYTRSIFNFSALKYDLTLEHDPINKKTLTKDSLDVFSKQADYLSTVVNEELGLNDFSRIGIRIYYLIGTESNENSAILIEKLALFQKNEILEQKLQGQIKGRDLAFIIASEDRKFRFSIEAVERQQSFDFDDIPLNIKPGRISHDQNKLLAKQEVAKTHLKINPKYGVMIDIDSYIENPLEIDAIEFIESSFSKNEQILTALNPSKG